jgi:hypothetical protein
MKGVKGVHVLPRHGVLDTEFSTQFTALFSSLEDSVEVRMMGIIKPHGKEVNGFADIAEHFGRCDVYCGLSEYGAC